MGFFVMIISMLLGIFFITSGMIRRKGNRWHIILTALGIVLALFAIYLGFPK